MYINDLQILDSLLKKTKFQEQFYLNLIVMDSPLYVKFAVPVVNNSFIAKKKKLSLHMDTIPLLKNTSSSFFPE